MSSQHVMWRRALVREYTITFNRLTKIFQMQAITSKLTWCCSRKRTLQHCKKALSVDQMLNIHSRWQRSCSRKAAMWISQAERLFVSHVQRPLDKSLENKSSVYLYPWKLFIPDTKFSRFGCSSRIVGVTIVEDGGSQAAPWPRQRPPAGLT